jgi:hypothetical protein
MLTIECASQELTEVPSLQRGAKYGKCGGQRVAASE